VLGASLAVFLIVLGPISISAAQSLYGVYTRLPTPIEGVLIDPIEARAAGEYIRRNAGPEDLVVGSPAFLWVLPNRVADFQQAAAAAGQATEHFPTTIPVERFAYPASIGEARYAVIDPIWRNWGAARMPAVAEMLATVEAWPLVYRSGDIVVHRNPIRR
jgi:hypothetical protein